MAFYGQLRLCEICSDREVYNTFNCKTLPNLSNLKPPHTPAGSRMLHLPWTKVKRNIGEDVAICSQRGVTNPINALHQHIQINMINDPNIAMASYLTPRGTRKLLTTSKFLKNVTRFGTPTTDNVIQVIVSESVAPPTTYFKPSTPMSSALWAVGLPMHSSDTGDNLML